MSTPTAATAADKRAAYSSNNWWRTPAALLAMMGLCVLLSSQRAAVRASTTTAKFKPAVQPLTDEERIRAAEKRALDAEAALQKLQAQVSPYSS